MFGFRDGESADTLARKRGYRRDAQETWAFLTIYDLATVRTPAELTAMVQARCSLISEAQATRQVQAWMQEKHF